LKSKVDVHKTSKDNKTVRYYLIKDDAKVRYEIEDKDLEGELGDIECI
jgi:hypothetical protein